MKKLSNKPISDPSHDTEKKDNKIEAVVLIAYVRETYGEPRLALYVLNSIIGKRIKKFTKEKWGIAKFIAERTSYISVEEDYDVDVEKGDWGLPVMMGAARPINVDILDKNNLSLLRQEVKTFFDNISNFVSSTNRPRWVCQKCGRFLGKELSSASEVKKLLRDFSMGKYHKCRSCPTNNYFTFNSDGIVFHSKPID